MLKLKSLETIKSTNRISSVDIFRSLAIISVILYHFSFLPFGYLGVDLFFLISGLLVGGILTKEFENGKKINFFKFVLQRGFKIWPSYYAFILFGNIIAFYFYHITNPQYSIPFWDMKRYLFFYQNYTGKPFHFCFEHVWSLCVEEHFYILLPIMFIFIQNFIKDNYKKLSLFVFVILTIIAGIVFKFLSYYFTHSQDTSAATHNRIDALAWGVLLNLIISYHGEKLKSLKFSIFMFTTGLVIFITALYLSVYCPSILFNKIYFHSIIPISFFCMIIGLYYFDFSKLRALRIVSYYSYNWYLWHTIFISFISRNLGVTIGSLIIYIVFTFLVAVIATIFIEETFLSKRKVVLDRIFKKNKGHNHQALSDSVTKKIN